MKGTLLALGMLLLIGLVGSVASASMLGDFDHDGMVYIPDYEYFESGFKDPIINPPFPDPRDLDGDGVLTIIDQGIFAKDYGNGVPVPGPDTPPADINCDGQVDVVDLGILAKHYDEDWTRLIGTTEAYLGVRCYGDLNGDFKIDVVDLGVLAKYYGASTPMHVTPEPASLSPVALALAALRRRR